MAQHLADENAFGIAVAPDPDQGKRLSAEALP
jgi:hypothetical protein